MNTTIRQRENGKYQAIISYKDKNGKWKQKSQGGFDKRKDASLWAKEMSFELIKLEKSGVLDNNYTLEEVFNLFIEFKNLKISQNSQNAYSNTMLFFKDFKDQDVNQIKSTEVLEFIKKKRLEKNFTYNGYVQNLKVIFNFAIKNLRACQFNPCDLLYKVDGNTDNREKFISEEFYSDILNTFKKNKYKLVIRTLYETGARISEVLGITTKSVNAGLINIDKQYDVQLNKMTNELKTKNSYRQIPISNNLFHDLKKADCDISGRIFYDINYATLYKKLKKLNISPHCFRHTRATILVSSGIDLTLVSDIMGDKIETILNTYTKVNKNNIEEKYEKIRQLL